MRTVEFTHNSGAHRSPLNFNRQSRNIAPIPSEEQTGKPQLFFHKSPKHTSVNYVTQKIIQRNSFNVRGTLFNMGPEFIERPKIRRSTMPKIICSADLTTLGHTPLSPDSNEIVPVRINFSYKSLFVPRKFGGRKLTIKSTTESRIFPAQTVIPQTQERILCKQMKLKIDNNVISFCYAPQKSAKTRPIPSFIKSLKHSRSHPLIGTEKGLMRSESHPNIYLINKMKDSNQNSTETTKSIPPFQDTPKLHKNVNFIKMEGSSLLDQLSASKALHKTVLIDNNSYYFGGLLRQENTHYLHTNVELQSERQTDWDRQVEGRQWKIHVKRLIIDEQHQNLQQSFHCGADIRNESPGCDLLNSFGREIKGSYLADQE